MKFSTILNTFVLLAYYNSTAQNNQKCEIEDKKDYVIKVENNNGVINNARELNIKTLNCYGICVFIQNNAIYLLQELIPEKNIQVERTKFLSVTTLKSKQIAQQMVSKLPLDKQNCIKEFVESKVQSGNYSVFETANQNSVLLEIEAKEDELVRNGLKIIYEEKEGITRIQELGRYYYLKDGDCLVKTKNGICERYDFATDFDEGLSVVGVYNPSLSYQILNNKGKKSEYNFQKYYLDFTDRESIKSLNLENNFFIWEKGKPQKYSSEEMLRTNFIIITYNGKYGLITYPSDFSFEKILLTLKKTSPETTTQYNYISIISDTLGLAYAQMDNDYLVLNLKYGFIYPIVKSSIPLTFKHLKNSNTVIGIQISNGTKVGYYMDRSRRMIEIKYDSIIISKDFIKLKLIKCKIDGKYFFLDFKGNEVIGRYDFIEDEIDSNGFIRIKEKGKYGYINLKNNLLIKPTYSYLSNFGYYDLAWASQGNYKSGLVDRKGNFSILEDFTETIVENSFSSFNKYGISCIKQFIPYIKSPHYGIVNYQKEILLKNHPNSFTILDTEYKDIGLVTDKSNFNFFVKDGNRISEIFSQISNTNYLGFRKVKDYMSSKMYTFIDKNFKLILPCQFDEIIDMSQDSLFWGKTGGLYYLYNFQGQRVSSHTYKSVQPFSNSFASVECVEGGACLIDKKGEKYPYCLPYDNLSDVILDKYSIVSKSNLKGIIDIHTQAKYLPPSCDTISLSTGLFICKKGSITFNLEANPKSNFLKCVSGDCEAFNTLRVSKKE